MKVSRISRTSPVYLNAESARSGDLTPMRKKQVLLLVATLVARLAKQLAVLLLRHTLAALLDD
jgi:hypothetical protein